MELQRWEVMYEFMLRESGNLHCPRKQFSDLWVVMVFLWSVVNDRPRCWACDPANWPERQRWRTLPSEATLSRRLRSVGTQAVMGRAERALRERFGHGPLKLVDAKPLPVGGYSKDRDARSGYATGTLARGYKLHVLRDARCPAVPDHWVVASMNHKEVAVAPDLLDQRAAALAMALAGAAVAWVSLFGYLAGDNGYDSNRLYDLAMEVNLQLVAPPRRSAKGLGKIRHSPHRLRGLELARAPHPLNPLGRAGVAKSFGRGLLRERDAIERSFGTWGNWGGGLGPLPNWVRRPRRVALWVAGKLLCNGVRQALKEGLLPHGRPNEKQRLAA